MLAELEAAGVAKPALLAATKADEAGPEALAREFPELDVLGVSVLDDRSLELFRQAVWRLTGLMRVFLRSAGEIQADPVALHPPVTVLDVADSIHHELGARSVGARIWGPSARFDGQRVGREHELMDGDAVEILS